MRFQDIRKAAQTVLVTMIIGAVPSSANSEVVLDRLYEGLRGWAVDDYERAVYDMAELLESKEDVDRNLVLWNFKQLYKNKLYQHLIDNLICAEENILTERQTWVSSFDEKNYKKCVERRNNDSSEYFYYLIINIDGVESVEFFAWFEKCSRRYTLYSYMLRFPPYEFLKVDKMRAYDTGGFLDCMKNAP